MTTGGAFGELRRTISGEVTLPADAGYDEARTTFNGTIDRRPSAIVRARGAPDIVAAVRWARDADLPIAVRGGGHSVAGHAVADGALVIDLRDMRGIVVDPLRRRARVAGGALWEDVDRATTAHGLAMPGGTFGDTGVGGLTLGGGIGFLMGTAGLTCDNLIRAEVVTADGSLVIAGEDGDPELLWGLRGGGGNFGVVTEFEFNVHPVGPLWAGYVTVPIESAEPALEVAADLARNAPPELAIFAEGPSEAQSEAAEGDGGNGAPSARDLFALGFAYQGPQDTAEPFLRPLRSLPGLRDTMTTMSYIELQAMSGILPFGLRHYWKGHFVRDLDAPTIGRVVEAITQPPGAFSFLLLEALTGAARHGPPGGAAFGQREARWNVSALAIWEDAADDGDQIAWARTVADSLATASLTGAGYANYLPADETADRVRAAFGAERFERLAQLKRHYDPDNVFRFNLNIPPAPD